MLKKQRIRRSLVITFRELDKSKSAPKRMLLPERRYATGYATTAVSYSKIQAIAGGERFIALRRELSPRTFALIALAKNPAKKIFSKLKPSRSFSVGVGLGKMVLLTGTIE